MEKDAFSLNFRKIGFCGESGWRRILECASAPGAKSAAAAHAKLPVCREFLLNKSMVLRALQAPATPASHQFS
jgi:hypothetical protein